MSTCPPQPVFPLLTPHPGLRLLVQAYSLGAFPMAQSRSADGVEFFTADPRCIFPLDGSLQWPRSLRSKARRGGFTITSNTAFEEVVRACADAARRHDPLAGELPGTWINDWIIETYAELHDCGMAHSIEAWLPASKVPRATDPPQQRRPVHIQGEMVLVGGLYGVQLGAAFCGESMFSRADLGGTDASKVCLVKLVEHLTKRGFVVLDSQISNAHTSALGGTTVSLSHYGTLLAQAITRPIAWNWTA